jgi:hypothetical protein
VKDEMTTSAMIKWTQSPDTASSVKEVPVIPVCGPIFKVVAKKGDPGKTVCIKILSPSSFNCKSSYSFMRSGIHTCTDAK